jgi:hypothetical protein
MSAGQNFANRMYVPDDDDDDDDDLGTDAV